MTVLMDAMSLQNKMFLKPLFQKHLSKFHKTVLYPSETDDNP